jgi:hypothetical protein
MSFWNRIALSRRLRRFKRARLTIELVPPSTWGQNLRGALSGEQWDCLRQAVYRRAGYRCEICGERGATHPVECHERWAYDDAARVQRLIGLVALCPACHAVKHIGRSYAEGDGDAALARLMRVNGWSRTDAVEYVDLVFDIWQTRRRGEWRLDLEWLTHQYVR